LLICTDLCQRVEVSPSGFDALQDIKQTAQDIKQAHPHLSENDVSTWHRLVYQHTRSERMWSQLLSGLATGLMGGDVSIAHHTATTATENNFGTALLPLLVEAGVISVEAYKAYRLGSAAYALYNLSKNVKDKAKEKATEQHGSNGSPSGSGGGDREPDEDPKNPKKPDGNFKTSNFVKGDKVDLERFTQRQKVAKNKPYYVDPKTKQYIQEERALNSGSGAHSGVWKLFNKNGKMIAVINKYGDINRIY